jgi:hypothetical protein
VDGRRRRRYLDLYSISVTTLKTCRRLTSLLSFEHGNDRCCIRRHFQGISVARNFQTSRFNHSIYGTLGLKNLRVMAINSQVVSGLPAGVSAPVMSQRARNPRNLLPINSITRLETLSIREFLVRGFYNPRFLDPFVDVIRPLDKNIVCHLLMAYPRRLTLIIRLLRPLRSGTLTE